MVRLQSAAALFSRLSNVFGGCMAMKGNGGEGVAFVCLNYNFSFFLPSHLLGCLCSNWRQDRQGRGQKHISFWSLGLEEICVYFFGISMSVRFFPQSTPTPLYFHVRRERESCLFWVSFLFRF